MFLITSITWIYLVLNAKNAGCSLSKKYTNLSDTLFSFSFPFYSHTLLFWIVTTIWEKPLDQSRLALLLSWKQHFYSVCCFGSLNWPDGSFGSRLQYHCDPSHLVLIVTVFKKKKKKSHRRQLLSFYLSILSTSH